MFWKIYLYFRHFWKEVAKKFEVQLRTQFFSWKGGSLISYSLRLFWVWKIKPSHTNTLIYEVVTEFWESRVQFCFLIILWRGGLCLVIVPHYDKKCLVPNLQYHILFTPHLPVLTTQMYFHVIVPRVLLTFLTSLLPSGLIPHWHVLPTLPSSICLFFFLLFYHF